MENYIVVNTKEVRDKSLILGYGYGEVKLDDPFVFLNKEGFIFSGGLKDYHDYKSIYKNIGEEEFLNLPEPIRIGDIVRFKDSNMLVFFKVNYDSSVGVETLYGPSSQIAYESTYCRKATDEEIEVLGLSHG